jgi:hypothetical protein
MVLGAHLFVLTVDVQAGLEQVVVAGKNVANISQCSVAWEGFP